MFTPPTGAPLQAVVATGHERNNATQMINIALYNEDGDPMTAVTSEAMTEFVTQTELTAALAPKLTATQAAAQVDSVATTAAGAVADLNLLLAKLRAAGIMHA